MSCVLSQTVLKRFGPSLVAFKAESANSRWGKVQHSAFLEDTLRGEFFYMKLLPREISLNSPKDLPMIFVALLLGRDVFSIGIRSGMAPAHHVQCSNSATAFRRPDYQQYHGIRQVSYILQIRFQQRKPVINRISVK